MKGRKQGAWVQDKVAKEVMKEGKGEGVIEEMKEEMKYLKLWVEEAKEHREWHTQRGVEMEEQEKVGGGGRQERTTGTQGTNGSTIRVEDMWVPIHLVEWFQRVGETIDEATVSAKKTMEKYQEEGKGMGGVKLKGRIIRQIEEEDPELRATNLTAKEDEVEEMIGQGILVNMTGVRKGSAERAKAVLTKVMEAGRKNGMHMCILGWKPLVGLAKHKAEVMVGKTITVENPTDSSAPVAQPRERLLHITVRVGETEVAKRMGKIMEKGGDKTINNMYEKEEVSEGWYCPACGEEGERWNKIFGKCNKEGCLGVVPEKTWRDTSTKNKRRAEVVIVGKTEGGKGARTFWTDGSGQKLVKGSSILSTGWAVVEARWKKGG